MGDDRDWPGQQGKARRESAAIRSSLRPAERGRLDSGPLRFRRRRLERPSFQPLEPRSHFAADIVWVNRATATAPGADDTDGFGAVFGPAANIARGVVDAAIVSFERVIGSFNYPDGSDNYSLTVSMGTAATNTATATLGTTSGGKPKSGAITIGAGTDGHGAGWFVDPSPLDSSEFTGAIVNAFAGDAQAGSPAAGLADLFTAVASEMTHCMGLAGSALARWAALTTNTGIPDLAEAGADNADGTRGTYWVFRGPSIKHLLTSNSGGAGGVNFGSAIHSAGPGASNQPLLFSSDTYIGAQDNGNAVFEPGRRYLLSNVFALMFADAFAYSAVDPAQFGTFYCVLDDATKTVTVRGGDFVTGLSGSDDAISITRSGNTVLVRVDSGHDVPGTGALPGAGDLPAFVTQFDISQLSSIAIDAGAGNDAISIAANVGVPISVNGGTGTNSLTIAGGVGGDTVTVNAATVVTDSETIALSGGISAIAIDGGPSADTINVQARPAGIDFVAVLPSPGADIVNVNTDNTGTAAARFASSLNLGALNIGGGGLASVTAGANLLLNTESLSITTGGKLDLADADLLISSPTALPPVQQLINIARAGGGWTGGWGITSSAARDNAARNTTLGAMSGADFLAVNGPLFDGQPVAAADVLVKYTFYGDTDFNGAVTFDDYVRTDTGFNSHLGGWRNGDFDANGLVNFDDYVLIDLAFNTQGAVLARAGGMKSGA